MQRNKQVSCVPPIPPPEQGNFADPRRRCVSFYPAIAAGILGHDPGGLPKRQFLSPSADCFRNRVLSTLPNLPLPNIVDGRRRPDE